jgi:hypothetical protein
MVARHLGENAVDQRVGFQLDLLGQRGAHIAGAVVPAVVGEWLSALAAVECA